MFFGALVLVALGAASGAIFVYQITTGKSLTHWLNIRVDRETEPFLFWKYTLAAGAGFIFAVWVLLSKL